MLRKISILNVGITNETSKTILEYILQRLKKRDKFYIVTPNPELLVIAQKHKSYNRILNNAEISLADGAGLFMASIFLGKPLQQRIPGVDFMDFLCKNFNEKPVSIGFLGGRGNLADTVAKRLLEKYPKLKISYVSDEWSESGFVNANRITQGRSYGDLKVGDSGKIVSQTRSIDILFVAFGSPKQEEWIYKNLDSLPVKAAMGVGGSFDFIAGRVNRAPRVIRFLGFEWLYRLIIEPWRWRRQLSLLTFVKLVLRERFHRN